MSEPGAEPHTYTPTSGRTDLDLPRAMVGERKQVTVLFADRDDLVLSCYLSRDFHEGVRAFLEKRTPDWQGR